MKKQKNKNKKMRNSTRFYGKENKKKQILLTNFNRKQNRFINQRMKYLS